MVQGTQARTEQPDAEQSDKQPAEQQASNKRRLLSRKTAAAALPAPRQATAEQSDGTTEPDNLACSNKSGSKTVRASAEDKQTDAGEAEAEHNEPVRSRKSEHKRARQVTTPQLGEPEVGPPIGYDGNSWPDPGC